MEKTAVEFLEQYLRGDRVHDDIDRVVDEDNAIEAMIEFAKFHVEAALEGASKAATINKNRGQVTGREFGNVTYSVNQPSILNAYPLDNIK